MAERKCGRQRRLRAKLHRDKTPTGNLRGGQSFRHPLSSLYRRTLPSYTSSHRSSSAPIAASAIPSSLIWGTAHQAQAKGPILLCMSTPTSPESRRPRAGPLGTRLYPRSLADPPTPFVKHSLQVDVDIRVKSRALYDKGLPEYLGCFSELSRANHSCSPNMQ